MYTQLRNGYKNGYKTKKFIPESESEKESEMFIKALRIELMKTCVFITAHTVTAEMAHFV